MEEFKLGDIVKYNAGQIIMVLKITYLDNLKLGGTVLERGPYSSFRLGNYLGPFSKILFDHYKPVEPAFSDESLLLALDNLENKYNYKS